MSLRLTLMYSANVCKLFRICKRNCAGVYAISQNNLRRWDWYIWSSLSSRRRQCKEFRLVDDHVKRFFSSNHTRAFLVEDTPKLNASNEDSQDAVTVGPPTVLLQSLDAENQQKLNELWVQLKAIDCEFVPKRLSISQWQEAMEKETFLKRVKFFRYLRSKEDRKEARKRRKEALQLAETTDSSFHEQNEDIRKNNIFLPISNRNKNIIYNSWQCQAIQFGQNVVIDLGFDDHMGEWEKSNCAQQISRLYGFNKTNRQPFHLHLCNASPDSQVLQFLEQCLPNLYSHTCMMTVTEKSYLDVFPKEQLMYLTPHCINDLMHYDHNAVYIIGGMVDKIVKRQVSMDKAQREGIAMACLPIYHYLNWGHGTKSLTLDQVMKIMLDMKNTNCWNTAFKNVPRRKLKRIKNEYSSCEAT